MESSEQTPEYSKVVRINLMEEARNTHGGLSGVVALLNHEETLPITEDIVKAAAQNTERRPADVSVLRETRRRNPDH